VVDMVAPGQSDQDVDVQQVWFHASSSAASVCSSVIGGASSEIEERGNEALASIRGVGWIPLRARPAGASLSARGRRIAGHHCHG
jgi:hypothetical protein